MYLVIEICDRECAQAVPCRTRQDASAKANELLKEHLALIGKPGLYNLYARPEPPDRWPQEAHLDDPADGESGAWCNAGGMRWDAHVACVQEPDTALDILLKELCKKAVEDKDSGCGDGSCGDCPITAVLDMLGNSEEDADGEE